KGVGEEWPVDRIRRKNPVATRVEQAVPVVGRCRRAVVDGVALQLEHAVGMDGLRGADPHQTSRDQDGDNDAAADAAKPAAAEATPCAHLIPAPPTRSRAGARSSPSLSDLQEKS